MGEDIEVIKLTVDKIIDKLNNASSDILHCPPEQMKNHYLKCCFLLFAYQRIGHVELIKAKMSPMYEATSMEKNIKLLKEWLPILRDNLHRD